MWLTIVRIIHLILSLILIVVVLLQSGKAQGLSGAIAGGSETFFGKNKGRTIDAILEKVDIGCCYRVFSNLCCAVFLILKTDVQIVICAIDLSHFPRKWLLFFLIRNVTFNKL